MCFEPQVPWTQTLMLTNPCYLFVMRLPSKREKVVCCCPSYVFSQVDMMILLGLQWDGNFFETYPFDVEVQLMR